MTWEYSTVGLSLGNVFGGGEILYWALKDGRGHGLA